MSTYSKTEKVQIFGVPGVEQKMLVLFGTSDVPIGSKPLTMPGNFRVQFLLAKPGRLNFSEDAPSFLEGIVGDSHLGTRQADPAQQNGSDVASMGLETHGDGWKMRFRCVLNDRGFVGKIVADEVYAQDYVEAEARAHHALAPFLSAWSLTLDIPLHVETIQVTDLTTHTEMLHIRTPFLEMKPAGGMVSGFSEEFLQYASVYRESMTASSPFYRFLCLYKLVESIYLRRSRVALQAKAQGVAPRKYNEDVPLTREAIRGIVSLLYPWRTDRDDDLSMAQFLPEEAHDKRFKTVREKYLEPLRDGIAHGLMRSGEIRTVADRIEDVRDTVKWLPLLRIWVRLLLRIDFPTEFAV